MTLLLSVKYVLKFREKNHSSTEKRFSLFYRRFSHQHVVENYRKKNYTLPAASRISIIFNLTQGLAYYRHARQNATRKLTSLLVSIIDPLISHGVDFVGYQLREGAHIYAQMEDRRFSTSHSSGEARIAYIRFTSAPSSFFFFLRKSNSFADNVF